MESNAAQPDALQRCTVLCGMTLLGGTADLDALRYVSSETSFSSPKNAKWLRDMGTPTVLDDEM